MICPFFHFTRLLQCVEHECPFYLFNKCQWVNAIMEGKFKLP